MNAPVVLLDDFALTDLELHWQSRAPVNGAVTSNLQVGYRVEQLTKEPARFRLTLDVEDSRVTEGGAALGRIKVTAVGFFSFPEPGPQLDRGRAVRINGLTMLYGALRGALTTITGVFPPDFRYVLPAVNMLEVIRTIEGRREDTALVPPHTAPKVRPPKRRPRATASLAKGS
jgi:hypothetical protein